MATKPRSPIQVRQDGFRALLNYLGAADTLRFLQQFESGQGDYTRDRHLWLDDLTVSQVAREIEAGEVGKADSPSGQE